MGRSLRQKLESRDILQEVLLKTFRRLSQFRGSGHESLMAWMVRIAENEIRDQADFFSRQRRDAAREVPLDDGMEDRLPSRVRSALSQAIWNQAAARLERALEDLKPEHREVIVLRKLEERSFPDIARQLDKSEDACRMLLARAMTALTLRMSDVD